MAKRGQSKYMSHIRARTAKKAVAAQGRDGNRRLGGLTEGKGKHGLNCNVTACQKPNSAWWWNSSTRAWYCADCAYDIQKANWRDAWWVQHYDYTLMTPPSIPAIIDLEKSNQPHTALGERFALKKPNGEMEYALTMDEVQSLLERWRIRAGLHDDGDLPGWYEQQLVQLRKDSGKPYVDLLGNRPEDVNI